MDATGSLPTGTVTFLFTDIEGSTQLWEQHPEPMRFALARHDALLQAALVPASSPCVLTSLEPPFSLLFRLPGGAVLPRRERLPEDGAPSAASTAGGLGEGADVLQM